MTDLPAPPPGGAQETISNKRPERKGSILRVILAVVVFVGIVAGAFMFLTGGESTSDATPSPSEASTPAVELTRETVEAKMERIAFYLGRNQPEGAKQIVDDMIRGTGCKVTFSGWGLYDSKKAADETNFNFRQQAGQGFPGAHVAAATAKVEQEFLEELRTRFGNPSGKYIAAGLVVSCP